MITEEQKKTISDEVANAIKERLSDLLVIIDQDGDRLELGDVNGFGEPMLALFIYDSDDPTIGGVNLTLTDAARMIERLKRFTTRGQKGDMP